VFFFFFFTKKRLMKVVRNEVPQSFVELIKLG